MSRSKGGALTGLFLQWLYSDAPAAYWQYRKQLSAAFFSFFSISLLSKTLFDPWRHDQIDVSRLPLKERFQAMGNNAMSRFIGFTLRVWVILIGFGLIGAITIGTILFLIAWYLLPLLLLVTMGYGFKLLLGV